MSHHNSCYEDRCCRYDPCRNQCCGPSLFNGCGNFGFLSGCGGNWLWIIIAIAILFCFCGGGKKIC